MTTEAGKENEESAKDHHERGEYDAAVDAYTAAAYEYLGEYGLDHRVTAARGLKCLGLAAALLRHQQHDIQCQNRCWQGVYISEAIAKKAEALPRERYAYDQSVRGVWREFTADFRTVGGLPGQTDAYTAAREFYADAGDPQTAGFEQLHLEASVLTKALLRGTDTATDELATFDTYGPTLTDWVRFKQRRLPEALVQLDEHDDWTYIF